MQMFQRLGLRSVLFTRQGALTGILTKMVRSLSLWTSYAPHLTPCTPLDLAGPSCPHPPRRDPAPSPSTALSCDHAECIHPSRAQPRGAETINIRAWGGGGHRAHGRRERR